MKSVQLTKQSSLVSREHVNCLLSCSRFKSWINGPSYFIHLSIIILFVFTSLAVCPTYATKAGKPVLESDVIENVDAAKLFRMIDEHEYLAVFFCKYFIC